MATPLEQFKATIISIRDILRKGGITGMDSMKHCTLYITARYMSAERCRQFEIPAKFAWETILETSRKGGIHIQVSRDSIYNVGGVDCLVNHFDTLFKTTEFLFRIEAAEHIEIMEKLAPIELDAIHLETDLLGWVYEQHLKKGSSSARDLGQFFTDRSITTYMTTLCNPKRSETICDPTMGTGGFLTSALHHLQTVEKLTDTEIRAAKDKFHGFDIDKFVSSIASINMFIESHGTVFPNIVFRDSLAKGAIVPYDVILANMPFGVKGLTYARCHESVKSLHLDGTKSEPLFLQWMMVSLNLGGRCAVVVPDGMLVNNSKCHNETRKYLLDHFELKRVIKMKGQFFMNTGIQPSILFFEKTGKPTTTVEFWDTEKNADGSIKEDLILSIARTAIDETHSFDMRHYQTVDAVENPAGFLMVKLGDILTKTGSGKTNSTSITNSGIVPFYGCTNIVPSGSHDTYDFDDENYFLFAKSGGNAKTPISNNLGIGRFHLVHGRSAANIAIYQYKINSLNESKLIYKYVYWILLSKLSEIQSFAKYTTGNGNIDVESMLNTVKISLLPIPIQEKIVEDLDLIYQNADFAKKSADSVKRQMAAVMRSVSARGFEQKNLGDVCVKLARKGTHSAKDHDETGTYSLFTSSLYNIYKLYTYDYSDLCCIINSTNASGKAVINLGQNFSVSSDTFVFKASSDIMTQYIQLYLSNNIHLVEAEFQGSNHKHPTWDRLSMIKIPIPPLPIQTETLAILNEIKAELKVLEQMAAKAEERAQFILDGYLFTPVEEETTAAILTHAPAAPISNVLTHEPAEPDLSPAYESMTRSQLLEECKKKNLKGVSSKKKEDLIKMLESL